MRRFLPGFKKLESEQGQVIPTFAIAIIALVSMVGLAVDIGQARQRARQAQNIADAAALSAVDFIAKGKDVDTVRTEAKRIVLSHGYATSDINGGWDAPSVGSPNTVNTGGIQVGTKANSAAAFVVTNVAPNAVRVKLLKNVSRTFSLVMGSSDLIPTVTAVAVTGPGGGVECPLPYTVELATLNPGGVPRPVYPATGSDFTAGKGAPGNWGTFGRGSCDFFCAINSGGSCGAPLKLGDTPTTDTGNPNQIRNAFNAHVNSVYTFPIANSLPDGHHQFTVMGFIKVQVLTASGNGANVVYNFRLLEYVAGGGLFTGTPPVGSIGKGRVLAE